MLCDVGRRLLPTALAALLAAFTLLLGVAGTSTTTFAGRTSGAAVHHGSGGASTGAAVPGSIGRLAVRERLAAAASRILRGQSSSVAHATPRAGVAGATGGAKAGAAAVPEATALPARALVGVAAAAPVAAPVVSRRGVPSGRGPPATSGV